MNILLSVEPDEFILGILYWALIIVGITFLVKFFQTAKDVRNIKDILEDIAKSIKDKD